MVYARHCRKPHYARILVTPSDKNTFCIVDVFAKRRPANSVNADTMITRN